MPLRGKMVGLTILYFDCFSGASGDMILGALIDAGVPIEEVRRALGSLAIAGETVWTDRVIRAGVSATKFCVVGEEPAHGAGAIDESVLAHGHAHTHDHDHSHGSSHGHGSHDHGSPSHGHAGVAVERSARHAGHAATAPHVHRTVAEIHKLIDGSALSAAGRTRAKHLFDRLADAEASVHGISVQQVHLHEVGALDSIIDVVGTVFAMEWLGAGRVVSSPLNVGGGTVRSAHGVYPVPAPATVRLLSGAPVYSGSQQIELVTPTGALLITGYAEEFGGVPAMRLRQTGYGAGARDLPETPNVLRVLIGEADDAASAHTVSLIEAEIDDMNPQIFGVLMERLLADGALDVYYTPIQMKKNRPGTLLTVVAPVALRERMTATIFRETTTIGVRFQTMTRECLDRETVVVGTPLGAIRIKVARRNGHVLNASPEFDDCVRVAAEHGRAVKDVQALAMKTFLER